MALVLAIPGLIGGARAISGRAKGVHTGQRAEVESITVTSNGLSIPAPATGNQYTLSDGTFTDEFEFCSLDCPSGLETDMTQAIFDQPPGSGTAYELNPNSLRYTCSGISVDNQ